MGKMTALINQTALSPYKLSRYPAGYKSDTAYLWFMYIWRACPIIQNCTDGLARPVSYRGVHIYMYIVQ